MTESIVDNGFLWGVTIDLNGKISDENDIISNSDNKKLNKAPKNYTDIIQNIELLKESTDAYLQKIIDTNPHLLTKEKKQNNEEENIEC